MEELDSLSGRFPPVVEKELTTPTRRYVLGDAEYELRRLFNQSRLIGNVTEQVMQQAGINPGMTILDCACGVGDLSFDVARLVGPSGRVLGIDQSARCVDRARERAAEAGLRNVWFEVADLASFRVREPVDAVVGKLILMYLQEPAVILSHFARQVRPGGLIVFQEIVLSMLRSRPSSPLVEKCGEWIHDIFARAGADVDMGWKLSATFQRAGLPSPQMFLGTPVEAKSDSPMYEHIAETVRSLLPMMEHYGVASAEEVMIGSLTDRLRVEMTAAQTVCERPVLIGAWTRKPDEHQDKGTPQDTE